MISLAFDNGYVRIDWMMDITLAIVFQLLAQSIDVDVAASSCMLTRAYNSSNIVYVIWKKMLYMVMALISVKA